MHRLSTLECKQVQCGLVDSTQPVASPFESRAFIQNNNENKDGVGRLSEYVYIQRTRRLLALLALVNKLFIYP